jgi:hypothetical protein
MKTTIAKSLSALLIASLVMVSFSNCTKNATGHEEMDGMSKRSSSSLNLSREYRATLNSLNNSGVMGMAKLTLKGNMLTVKIDATGLEALKSHLQHIHGFTDNKKNSNCPTMAADTNGDGIVDLVEGLPSYGPVLLSLDPTPVADANGEVHYMQTFTISPSLLPLQNRAIVLHGLTVNGVYMPTVPVACGQVQPW